MARLLMKTARLAIGMCLATTAMVLSSPAFAEDHGKEVFELKCGNCHSATKGAKPGIGPNLFGLVGRPAGTFADFKYSPAMKNSGLVWTEEQLTTYLKAPGTVVLGTKMKFIGLKKPEDVAAVVGYLKTAK